MQLMDDATYHEKLETYRTWSLEELAEALRKLRAQMKDQTISPQARRAAVGCFGVAWHVYEEKGGDIRRIFPQVF